MYTELTKKDYTIHNEEIVVCSVCGLESIVLDESSFKIINKIIKTASKVMNCAITDVYTSQARATIPMAKLVYAQH